MKKLIIMAAIAASFGAQAKVDDLFETGNGFEAKCNAYGYWMHMAKEGDASNLEVLARRKSMKEAGGLEPENKKRCRVSMKRGERRAERKLRRED
ncbi:MAG: hypothetical protein ACRCUJ_08220 [Phocaeicola sp.]